MIAKLSKFRVAPYALMFLLSAPVFSQGDSAPVATIDSGRLVGTRFGPTHNEVMFLGIPYTAPPTGDRRWKAPQPVEKWPGVRKATSYGRLVLRQKTLRPKS